MRRVVSIVRSAPSALRAGQPALEANAYAVAEDIDLTVVLRGAAVELALRATEVRPGDVAGVAMPASAGGQDLRGLVESGVGILVAAAAGTVVFSQIFGAIGSFGQWADAWIFTGSVLATYGMARGWTEFWLIWVGVDIVGVPLLLKAGFYPSAILYAVYGGFVIWGFFVWMRAQRDEQPTAATAESPVVETLG